MLSENRIDINRIRLFQKILPRWYDHHGRKFPWRKTTTTKYQYVIAEVLLQRTRAETIAFFFPNFIRDYPSWKRLSHATPEQLQCYLQPIGLWRRRASSIHLLATEMAQRNGKFPLERKEIESLPGVGQYIANSILLFCHGEPQPLLDTNMARVLERVFGPRKKADIRYDSNLQKLALDIVTCEMPKKMNWAILDLAAIICIIKKPHCDICPLNAICEWNKKKNKLQ